MATPLSSPARPKIGVSACFMHPDPSRNAFAFKTLQYIEQSMAHWLMSGGALPVLVPSPGAPEAGGAVRLADYAQWLDGLVLHGGADVWPGSYGETALKPEWQGDAIRDAYEIELVKAFTAAGKPVFGICRGLQLINVAYGGTLYQDIGTQHPQARLHRDGQIYDQLFHALDVVPGSRLSTLLGTQSVPRINTIHHQGVKDLAPGFVVEARCPEDGIIEAIRHTGDAWVAAVQWHPEFHRADDNTLNDSPILQDFLNAALAARQAHV
jgi:putative glutamine amidotransferase